MTKSNASRHGYIYIYIYREREREREVYKSKQASINTLRTYFYLTFSSV